MSRRLMLVLATVVAFAAAVAGLLVVLDDPGHGVPDSARAVSSSTARPVTVTDSPSPPSLPSPSSPCAVASSTGNRLTIPSLDIAAPVRRTYVDDAGVLLVPDAGVGLWGRRLSAARGTTVLVGHVSREAGGRERPAVFWRLRKAHAGDLVATTSHGKVTCWRVVARKVSEKEDLDRSLFDLNGDRRLVIFTCADRERSGRTGWHYAANLVVVAEPMGVQ